MAHKTLAYSSLVEDFSLYPRNRVDDSHVGDLVRALASGHELPPIIVDADSLRVADGFHRRRAYLRHFGPDAKGRVELRKYATERDLFLDAVALNSHHGRKLDRHDQSRIVLKLREMSVSDETIAVTLHIPPQQVQTLSVRIVYEEATGEAKPAKRGMGHLYGTNLSAHQITAMQSVRSAEAGRLALELIRLLEHDLVNLEDPVIMERLKQLQKVIDRVLVTVAA